MSERTLVDLSTESNLNITAIVLAASADLPPQVILLHRKLGQRAFQSTPLQRVGVGRGIYRGALPLSATDTGDADFEYYLQANLLSGERLEYPVGGSTIAVVAMPLGLTSETLDALYV